MRNIAYFMCSALVLAFSLSSCNSKTDTVSDEEAIKAVDESIRLNPYDAKPWVIKGTALYVLGEYDEAVQALGRAVELDPKDAVAWHFKSEALKKLGRTTEADAAFAKAKELGYEG